MSSCDSCFDKSAGNSLLLTSGGTIQILSTLTATNTISGVIGNGTATTLAIIKNQAGTWTLSGNACLMRSQTPSVMNS